MADARIQDLPEISELKDNDNSLWEHGGGACRTTAATLIRYLTTACDNFGILGVHIGKTRPRKSQNLWIDTNTTAPVLQIRDENGNWSSVPVTAQKTTEGDFKTWNLEVNHPIGSIYLSRDPTSPEILFGGKWTQIVDHFIMTAGGKYPVGQLGGSEKTVITVENLPPHNHASGNLNTTGNIGLGDQGGSTQGYTVGFGPVSDRTNLDLRVATQGSGVPFRHMPPYIAYYCWERVE